MRGSDGRSAAAFLILLLLLARPARAQVSSMTLSGDPLAMVISTGVAGFGPDPVSDEGTTYSLTATEASRIEVQLDAPLPPGVTLWIQLEPPPGALGAGTVALSTAPQVLVSSIPAGSYGDLGLRYRLTATIDAGVVLLSSRNVTFTLTGTL